MSNIVCLYHANCADGVAAAWVVDKALGDDVVSMPVSYNREPDYEFLEGKDLYIVDFSYPEDVLYKLEEITSSLVLIDHHVTAHNNLKNFKAKKSTTQILIDKNYCGATLVWKYFFDNEDYPEHLRLIQDHDLWQHKFDDTFGFIEYIYHVGTNPGDYQKAVGDKTMDEIMAIGDILFESKMKRVRATVSRVSYESIEFEGKAYLIPVANCPPELASIVGHELCKQRNAPFSITYYDVGKLRNYSVRGTGKFNCAKFAESFGGGGHHNASGFSTRRPYWIWVRKRK